MKVKINQLIPGCILSEDIYKHTNAPIMKKKTVLTKGHINILKIFVISYAVVESRLVDGREYKPSEVIQEENSIGENKTDFKSTFMERYLVAVQKYKKLFSSWQAGAKVDAFAIRKVFLPLYEISPTKDDLIELHHYCTKEDYLYYHSVAVSILSYNLGKRLNLSNGEVIQLGLSALLSDCGMSKLPMSLLIKKDPLTIEEYEEVKKHPMFAYQMLKDIPGFSKAALLGVIQHHERNDASGYPLKLSQEKLHLFAKIISICDIYHAMTSERYYRKKRSPFKVIESLKQEHFSKIDIIVLENFILMILDLSIGKKVRLNNGEIGEIVFLDDNEPTRPIVKLTNNELLKLTSNRELYIEDMLLRDEVSN
ncbi:HD-GYP domain-containing protein [Evansella sp. AB-P1]|uniref:HD-GYP domain-containing protein n=1 Tax=Evansella sp. AB-P1 TaxID=3037653 RepID=UPI00241EF0B7|nr:HD-GYP domain-containing protein [Evansella sp. AB-P1]MDG5789394.1 HD-GYP domain-containing protein [Evansella sp. AB-P1]